MPAVSMEPSSCARRMQTRAPIVSGLLWGNTDEAPRSLVGGGGQLRKRRFGPLCNITAQNREELILKKKLPSVTL